jgi:hypothetical protein
MAQWTAPYHGHNPNCKWNRGNLLHRPIFFRYRPRRMMRCRAGRGAQRALPAGAAPSASGPATVSAVVARDHEQLAEEVVGEEQDDDRRAHGPSPAPSGAARGEREREAPEREHGE